MTNASACIDAPPWPRGVGGWMLIPMLATIISPMVYISDMFYHLGEFASPASPLSASRMAFISVELAVAALLAAAWIHAGFMLFQHKRIFPSLFIGLFAIAFVLSLVDTFVAALWLKVVPDDASVVNAIRPLIGLVIFGPYMAQSRRVKNTFVH